jgi:hypothetical protein
MSDVVRDRSGWVSRPTSPEAVGRMAHATAAAEIAVRAAVGVMTVRVATGLVRDHPLFSLLLACGVGYVLGTGWRVGRGQATSSRRR